MKIRCVIGKNFGDEGKGLATDYFAMKAEKEKKSCLVVKHNGGAQAGHTVEIGEKRFVFHQLSAGSFRGAATLWANPFMPDLYKLSEEIEAFYKMTGKKPTIYASVNCPVVYIDDVLMNMAIEHARGENRHGSCGMGINEAALRAILDDIRVTLGDVVSMGQEELYQRFLAIRKTFGVFRINDLGLTKDNAGEYWDLLHDETLLRNAVAAMKNALSYIQVINITKDFLEQYDEIIFEHGQGLLLDMEYERFAPHLTTSRTGLRNPLMLVDEYLGEEMEAEVEAVYVTRTYVTRHGAGPFPGELYSSNGIDFPYDETNVPNEWQGTLRYGVHEKNQFFEAMRADQKAVSFSGKTSFFITHGNETNGNFLMDDGIVDVKAWIREAPFPVENVYLSNSKYAEEVIVENI